MFKAHSTPRGRLRAAVGLGAAVASLAFAGIASAAVTVVQPDVAVGTSCPDPGTVTTSHLTTAISNSAAGDTLVLQPGIYCPVDPSGQQTITIAHNLNIVADHSYQATGHAANIQVVGLDATGTGATFTVPSGVSLGLEGFDIDDAGGTDADVFANSGSITMWGMAMIGSLSPAVENVTSTATATLNETTIGGSNGNSLVNAGALTLRDSSIIQGGGEALVIESGSTNYAYNTLFAANDGNCTGGKLTNNPAPGSLDDDGSCGVQYSHKTTATAPVANANYDNNGGPTSTYILPVNSLWSGKGVVAYCATVDQRFFVNPTSGGVTSSCDIGATTNAATQETTGPTCVVTNTAVDHTSQQVTLADPFSGIGPEIGTETDNLSNTPVTTYNKTAPPSPVPGYAVDNLFISNGTVSFTSPAAPTTAGIVLTAGNKVTPGINNSQWSFTGLNWAGLATNCA